MRLRYVLATGYGWLALPVAVGVEAFAFSHRGQPWTDDFVWATNWVGISILILGPVLAGLTAADSARLLNLDWSSLTLTTPRGMLAMVTQAAMTTLSVIIVHVAAATLYATRAAPGAGELGPGLLQLLVQLTILLFFGLAGCLIGAVWPSPWAAVTAAGVSYALLWFWHGDSGRFAPLYVGGTTGGLLGLEPDLEYAGLQTLWRASAIATCTGVLLLRWPWRSGLTVGIVACIVALGAAAVVIRAALDEASPYRVSSQPLAFDCRGREPQVCLIHQHRRFADEAADTLASIYRGTPAGVRRLLPDKVDEAPPTAGVSTDPAVGRFYLAPTNGDAGVVSVEQLARDLATPYSCPALFGATPPSQEYADAFVALAESFTAAAQGAPAPLADDEFARTYEAMMSCTYLRG